MPSRSAAARRAAKLLTRIDSGAPDHETPYYRAATRAIPDLEGHLRRGELLPLRDWLRTHVHSQGFRLPAEERVRQVTGHGLTDADFLAYLKQKYGALYGVAL